MKNSSLMDPIDSFIPRHIGSTDDEIQRMLAEIGFESLEQLGAAAVPRDR